MYCPKCKIDLKLEHSPGKFTSYYCYPQCSRCIYFNNKLIDYRIADIIEGKYYELTAALNKVNLIVYPCIDGDYKLSVLNGDKISTILTLPYFYDLPSTREEIVALIPKLLKLKAFS